MENKKIIIIIIIIVLLIAIIVGISNSNKKETSNNTINYKNTSQTLDTEEKSNVESNFNNALSEVRELFKKYGSQDFSIYFDIDFVNNYMEEGNIEIVNNIKLINFDGVNIYDTSGNKLEEFPTTFSDGTEIQYEDESYQVAPNKNYLLKIYSYKNSYYYYYILKYDKTGNATLTDICYTIGESSPVDNDLIDVTLDN
jgi:type II secretory pathway pseudopilin PulG